MALLLEGLFRGQARGRQLATLKQNAVEDTVKQNSAERGETRAAIAQTAGVSHDTIDKVKAIQRDAIPQVREMTAAVGCRYEPDSSGTDVALSVQCPCRVNLVHGDCSPPAGGQEKAPREGGSAVVRCRLVLARQRWCA